MDKAFIEKSFIYIENNLFFDLSLEQCANASGYSRYHFCRIFHIATGMTVTEYIRRRRVSEAARMINESTFTLKEIAYRTGFNSQENFIRVFRSVFGITPKDYKRTKYALLLTEADSLVVRHPLPSAMPFRKPDIISVPDFQVIGKKYITTFENEQQFKDVPVFWNQFYAGNLHQQLGCLTGMERIDHGVSILREENAGLYDQLYQRKGLEFEYLTGVRVSCCEAVPKGYDIVTIPSGLYARFYHRQADDYNLIQNLIDTWNFIDYDWLPNSQYEHAGTVEFNEYYPERNRLCKTIYIPINPKR